MKTTKQPKKCPYCGELDTHFYECPECMRDGCGNCMPAGNNCTCPECEEKED